MKRAGFTMIELIFVIVILGILGAVAIPKLVGTKEQADAAVCKAYYNTLNRTVGPALWANMSINDENETVAFTTPLIQAQIDTPSGCGTDAEILAVATTGTSYSVTVGANTYDVNATQASASTAPIWDWVKQP